MVRPGSLATDLPCAVSVCIGMQTPLTCLIALYTLQDTEGDRKAF